MEVPHDFCRISEIKGIKVISYEDVGFLGREKFCPNCRRWFDITEFSRDNYNGDRRCYCKQCDDAKRKRRRAREKQSVSTKAEKETA